MESVSKAHMMIMNLVRISEHHKKICNQSDCGVSLWAIKQAANHLLKDARVTELEELSKQIEDME